MSRISPALLRELAHEAGFDLVRFGPADTGADGARFLQWLEAGRAGEMEYLERNRDRIAEPRRHAPGALSTIALAQDYGGAPVALPGGGRVARYAAGRDYHCSLGGATKKIRERLEREGVARGTIKLGTDAVPILERALAARAGIGFLAKSAGVISPQLGPYLLLAELLVPFELPAEGPAPGSCGTCTACLDACPTGAITAPHEVDARLCLSYTTIEVRGPIPPALRARQGDWVFGCDVCLEVCPFTRFGRAAAPASAPRPESLRRHHAVETYTLVGLLELTEDQWQRDWTGTAMRRATRTGLRRNAAVVLGNLRDEAALPALVRALDADDALVRGHAAWALGNFRAGAASLERALCSETDASVRAELAAALSRARDVAS